MNQPIALLPNGGDGPFTTVFAVCFQIFQTAPAVVRTIVKEGCESHDRSSLNAARRDTYYGQWNRVAGAPSA